jgi:GNAT superfamily N-acetyltransferase
MSQQAVAVHNERVVATASGARIAPIPAAQARVFLARLDETAPERVDVALGAVEDDESLIGVAVLSAAVHRGAAMIAVLPSRRRLKVGSDLLHALLEQAATRAIYYLTGCPRRASAAATDALLRSFGLVAARHVHHGTATIVVVVAELSVPDEALSAPASVGRRA